MGGEKKKAQKLSAHPKRMHHHSLECIDETDEAAIGGNEDELAIIAELESCPLTSPIILHLKCCKWPLQKIKTAASGPRHINHSFCQSQISFYPFRLLWD